MEEKRESEYWDTEWSELAGSVAAAGLLWTRKLICAFHERRGTIVKGGGLLWKAGDYCERRGTIVKGEGLTASQERAYSMALVN
jgi:hypothetical protein